MTITFVLSIVVYLVRVVLIVKLIVMMAMPVLTIHALLDQDALTKISFAMIKMLVPRMNAIH
jgi:hypothetical protein